VAPLSWHRQAIPAVEVTALHDGRDLALCLRWRDPTGTGPSFGARGDDRVAVQLATHGRAASFGNGGRATWTDVWRWRAAPGDAPWQIDELLQDRNASEADRGDVVIDAESYAGQILGSLAPEIQDVRASAEWHDGTWTVVLVRSLAPRSPREVALAPGTAVEMACAVWNDAAGDHDGHRSISIWHGLELE
jgi:DMSO reductase family type II enzyme heme b subunit